MDPFTSLKSLQQQYKEVVKLSGGVKIIGSSSGYPTEQMSFKGHPLAVQHLIQGGKKTYDILDCNHCVFCPTADAAAAFTDRTNSVVKPTRAKNRNDNDKRRYRSAGTYDQWDIEKLKQGIYERKKSGSTSDLYFCTQEYLNKAKSPKERALIDASLFPTTNLGLLTLSEETQIRPAVVHSKMLSKNVQLKRTLSNLLRNKYKVTSSGFNMMKTSTATITMKYYRKSKNTQCWNHQYDI